MNAWVYERINIRDATMQSCNHALNLVLRLTKQKNLTKENKKYRRDTYIKQLS